MSSANRLKEREVRFARALLHALHANETNGYLLLAIIAWVRGESGASWKGNNPLNLKLGGRRLTFRTYAAAATATARFLAHSKKADMRLITRIARRSAHSTSEQVAQARDVLMAVALSSWGGPKHYGLAQWIDPAGHWALEGDDSRDRVWFDPPGHWVMGTDPTKNQLLAVWVAMTGQSIPRSWFVDTLPPPPPPPAPKQPFRQDRTLENRFPKGDYIEPYHSREFYEARQHQQDQVLLPD